MSPEWRLVPVAAGAWLAAAVGTAQPASVSAWAAAAAAVCALLAAGRRCGRVRSVVTSVALGVGLAATSTAWHVHRLTTGPVAELARSHADVEVVLRLVRDPVAVTTANGSHLTLADATVTMVRTGARSTVTDAPVLVMTYGSGWIGLLPGQRVRLAGRLQPPRPGDDVTAVLDGRSPPDRLGRPPWWQRAAGHARASLRAAAAGLPPDERGLLPSLVDGDETLVPPALQADMRLTGLTHLEAVSGENLSVTLAITLAVARGVGLRRRARIAACALMLVGFVVLARPSASVQRAAVMGVAALVAMAIGRRATPLPALSVAVTVLVLADPFLGRAVGFVLSVLATAALVTVAPPATQWLSRWLPRPVALAIAVPTAAQLACTPVLLLTFGRLTPYAVPANLLAAIAVVPATVVGVATAVVSSLWRPAAVPLAWLGVLPTGWIADVARTFGGLPGAGMGVPGGPWWWILGVAGAGALGWQVSSRHRDILAGWQR